MKLGVVSLLNVPRGVFCQMSFDGNRLPIGFESPTEIAAGDLIVVDTDNGIPLYILREGEVRFYWKKNPDYVEWRSGIARKHSSEYIEVTDYRIEVDGT